MEPVVEKASLYFHLRRYFADPKTQQGFSPARMPAQLHLVVEQALHFQVQPVATAGSQPAIPGTVCLAVIPSRDPEIEFYRQLQVDVALALMAVVKTIEFTDRLAAISDRNIVAQQVNAVILFQEKMP